MPGITLTNDVDNTRLNSGMEAFHEKVSTVTEESVKDMGEFGKSMTKLGPIIGGVLAIIGGFKEAVGEAFEKSEEIQKMSGELSITKDKVQTLTSAAKFYGVASDELSGNLLKLSVNTQKALEGSEEQVKAFEDLGLSADDIKGKSLDQVFEKISDAVSNSTDKHKALLDVERLMGKSSGELAEMMNAGSSAIEAQGDKTYKLGAVTINTLNAMSRGWGIVSTDIVSWSGTAFAFVENSWNATANVLAGGINLLGIEFRTLGNVAYDSLHGNFNKIKQDVLDGSAQMDEAIAKAKQGAKDAFNVKGIGDDEDVAKFGGENGDGGFGIPKDVEEAAKRIQELQAETYEKQHAAIYENMDATQKLADLEKRIAEQRSLADPTLMVNTPLQKAEATAKAADLELEKAKLIKDQKKEHLELEKEYNATLVNGDTSHKDKIRLLEREQDSLVDAVVAATDKNDRLKAEIALQNNINEIKKEYVDMAKEEMDLARQKAAEESKNAHSLRETLGVRKHRGGSDGGMGGDLLANYNHYNSAITANQRANGFGSINDSALPFSQHNDYLNSSSAAKKVPSTSAVKDTTTPLLSSIDRTQKMTLQQIKMITGGQLGSGDQSFASA